jgi:4-amino-4-deoxy-L-arabinose transferase-like glycosyltransferase
MAQLQQPAATTDASRESSAPKDDPPKVERVARTTLPKPRHDVGLAWLVLLGLVILAALPLLIDFNKPGIWSRSEALSVAISAETAQRQDPIADGETSLQAWTPIYQGETRWDLPPGGTWLHLVAYTVIPLDTPESITTTDMQWVIRARIASIAMALLFVAAVFWAGYSIGGLTTGAASALVAMTMPLALGFGRHANPHVATLAWSALSIAGALWAMRPLRTSPSLVRQLVGWSTCGIALGLAALTTGPTAIPGTLACTVLLAMICPRRIGHIMGLIASTALAALLLMPWVLHVHSHDPAVWQQWLGDLRPDFGEASFGEILTRAGWRISLAAMYCGLWLIWLIPALTQPFSSSTGEARHRLMLGWGWLVTALLLVAFAPGETTRAGLLLALTPACVAIGLVVQQFHDLSAEGRHGRVWLANRWVTCVVITVLSIALPLLGYLLNHQPQAVQWLPDTGLSWLATMHWSFWAGASLALILASILATRFAIHKHPGRTIGCFALWLLIAFGLAAIPVSRSEQLNQGYDPPIEVERSARL